MKGKRAYFLTKSDLCQKLNDSPIVPDVTISEEAGLCTLLGHAMYYNLLSTEEIAETVPRVETTMSCYLWTLIDDPQDRVTCEQFANFSSEAHRRGTIILNLLAMKKCGPRLPGGQVSHFDVPVYRPRFENGPDLDNMRSFIELFDKENIKACGLKHAFMPKRFEDLDPNIHDIIENYTLPDTTNWNVMKEIMIDGNVSGWDNPINNMMSTFYGNVKVQVMKNMKKRIQSYLRVVPLNSPEMRELLIESVIFRPRPLIIENSDYEMGMSLRVPLMENPDCLMPKDAPEFTDDVFLIHLFLTRYGTTEMSYLPVAAQGRSYSYMDGKTASNLFSSAKTKYFEYEAKSRLANPEWRAKELEHLNLMREKENARRAKIDADIQVTVEKLKKRQEELLKKKQSCIQAAKTEDKLRNDRQKNNDFMAQENERRDLFDLKESEKRAKLTDEQNFIKPSTPTLGELIGMTPHEFNARRKAIVKRIRKANTEKIKSKSFIPEGKRRAFKKAVKHRKKVGYGKMDVNARFDSLRTDAVGLRLTLKTPIPMKKYVVEIKGDVLPIEKVVKTEFVKKSKKQRQIEKMNESEAPDAVVDPALKNAIAVGVDEGRAKLLTSAVLKPPEPLKDTSNAPVGMCKKKNKKKNKKNKNNKKTHAQEEDPTKEEDEDSTKKEECCSFLQGLFVACVAVVSTLIHISKDPMINTDQDKCNYKNDKWHSTTLTRNKYNAVTKLKIRRKFEQERMRKNPDVKIAHDAMSNSSLRSCDPESWAQRIAVENQHKDALKRDYFTDVEREKWRMVAFRKKKACLDRAVGNMIKLALKGEPKSRPLVIGIGDAAFPANGPRGETAVPTSQLAAAYKRAVTNLRKTGRRVVVLPISEHYTTKACCKCGATTTPALVKKRTKMADGTVQEEDVNSRRLRCCKKCDPIGKLRDRDVQAARNMQMATVARINGQARPAHLCRAAHAVDSKPTVAPEPSQG